MTRICTLALGLLAGCQALPLDAPTRDDVRFEAVDIRGTIRLNHNVLNFESESGVCFGMLVTGGEFDLLVRETDLPITLSAIVETNGCSPERIICSIHLCGPQTVRMPEIVRRRH